jgi:hypothetical protein
VVVVQPTRIVRATAPSIWSAGYLARSPEINNLIKLDVIYVKFDRNFIKANLIYLV